MKYKIVADSSANLLDDMEGISVTSSPFAMIVEGTVYEDKRELDVSNFIEILKKAKGTTSTACPGVNDWLTAFGDAEIIIGFTLTSKLSGAYNAAMAAANQYMSEHPGRKVHIVDTLSTGPELEVQAEKCVELMKQELSFENIVDSIETYKENTHLNFMLERLDNFARNGRVSVALAKAVGILGIRIIGTASSVGDLEPLTKCKGAKRGVEQLFKSMIDSGYTGGKARIRHSANPEGAQNLMSRILVDFPKADVTVAENRGLCSYYAEYGGILVGFEG